MGNRAMGAGASRNAAPGDRNQQPQGLFGQQPGAMQNSMGLTARQLQALVQEGRLEFAGSAAASPGSAVQPNRPAPVTEKAKVMKNSFNLAKNSIYLRTPEGENGIGHLEFAFDATKPCTITVHFLAREMANQDHLVVRFEPACAAAVSCGPFRFEAGMGQRFLASLTESSPFLFTAADAKSMLVYGPRSTCYPIVVDIRLADESIPFKYRPAQTTFITFSEPNSPNPLKVIKQKITVDRMAYEVHDVYGIKKQNSAAGSKDDDANDDDDDNLCVVCMCEQKDTLILPCRHMCLCQDCANTMRMQTNKCPICRGNIQSVMTIQVE